MNGAAMTDDASSMGPERYCVWLSKANHTYRVALRSTHLAVHFLTAADRGLAERFGYSGGPFRPLRVSDVGHLVPGHGSTERPDPPTERAAR
jgi:hypothetical protein